MNDSQGSDRDFIEYVVKQIVDEPDAVEVIRSVDELGVLITLKVGKFDMGKVIGKNGQTAKSLRTLLRVIGSKNNARVNLKIIEPDGSEVAMGGGMNGGMGDDQGGGYGAGAVGGQGDDQGVRGNGGAKGAGAANVGGAGVQSDGASGNGAGDDSSPVLEEDAADKHSGLPDDLDLEI